MAEKWIETDQQSEVVEPVTAASASKTPAPKKDQVKGSDKNKKGSASGGKKITFTPAIEGALRRKVESHNQKAPKGRRATLAMVKAVYRRGAGAFSVSHRPGMTRNQWAMARVNAFIRLLSSGKPTNSAYKSDNDLLPASHPKASKKKGMTASAGTILIPEEQELADTLYYLSEKYGKFDQDGDGIWAGYEPASENEVASIGVNCQNCVFYQGGNECQIIALEVEPMGVCRFAVLPEGTVKDNLIPIRGEDMELLLASAYAEFQLQIDLKPEEDYDSPESAILALTEFSGLGYEAEPAFRASWLRAVRNGENPFRRASMLASMTYDSLDSDLLPVRTQRNG